MRRHIAANHEIETVSGEFVDVNEPDARTIHVADIAHALSQTCRYGGHCRPFYSVAEHAVFVSWRLEREGSTALQLAGLHHDDAEAYLGDIPRPMKPLLGDAYEVMTRRMDDAILVALDLPSIAEEERALIKRADTWSLFVEAKHLLPSAGNGWMDKRASGRIITPNYWHGGLTPPNAAALYLNRHAELMEQLRLERAYGA